MSHLNEDFLERNFANCNDREKLKNIVQSLQGVGLSLRAEKSSLQRRNSSLERKLNSRQHKSDDEESGTLESWPSENLQSCWTLAEQGYPSDGSLAVFYDGRNFTERQTSELKGKNSDFLAYMCLSCQDKRVVISRFPSWWPGTIYVFTEQHVAASKCPHSRVRVTSQKTPPDDLKWTKTLHLNRLPLRTKMKILSGQIKWLFITEADSRSSTEDSVSKTKHRTRP